MGVVVLDRGAGSCTSSNTGFVAWSNDPQECFEHHETMPLTTLCTFASYFDVSLDKVYEHNAVSTLYKLSDCFKPKRVGEEHYRRPFSTVLLEDSCVYFSKRNIT